MKLDWRKWHFWLGLVIGVQVLIWTSTGVIFTLVPTSEKVAVTEARHQATAQPGWRGEGLDFAALMRKADGPIASIEFATYLGRDAVKVKKADGSVLVLSRDLSESYPLISEKKAVEIASADLLEPLEVESTTLMQGPLRSGVGKWDYYGDYPVWKVQFDTARRTRIYVDAATGKINLRRNFKKTVFDVAYHLHLATYWQNSMYHNWLLFLMGALALLLSITGATLAVRRLRRRKGRA